MKDKYYYDLNLKSDIVIVGGGPAGMVAAIAAARQGVRVILLERMDRVGKKLLSTGNGRCNLSNTDQSAHHYHTGDPPFVQKVFDQVSFQESIHFLESLGLSWKSDPSGKIFPASEQASSLLDLLRLGLSENNVQLLVKKEVTEIQRVNNQYRIRCRDLQELKTDAIIITCGGKARPNLGSNGSGFKLAEQLNHIITPCYPAQVQLCTDNPYLKSLKGLKQTCKATLTSTKGEVIRSETGEILFTDYGFSGIPILQLSRYVHDPDNQFAIHLDLLPGHSSESVKEILKNRIKAHPNHHVSDIFLTWIHKRITMVLLKECCLSSETICQTLTDKNIESIITTLKSWMFPISGTKSWSEAQVTRGGINLDNIHPLTLESKCTPNLYFSGEILDVDGDCGGYNLQWAWSSGILAGQSAAKSISDRMLQ